MSEHTDLLEAAMKAVDAVTARSSTVTEAVKGSLEPDDATAEYSLIDIGDMDDIFQEGSVSVTDEPEISIDFSVSALHKALEESIADDGQKPQPEDKNALTQPAPIRQILATIAQDCKPGENSGTKIAGMAGETNAAEYLSMAHRVEELGKSLETKDRALADLTEKLEAATAEITKLTASEKQLSDRLIRVNADFENYRKRITRDQEHMRNQAEERIVASFLSVMDNFERAIAHAKQSSDYEQLLRGVELTSRMYLSTLAKHGCVPFDSVGETFDPNYHDVLQRVIDPDTEDNIIVQEHLKGYKMHDRVLRPALVVVSQKSESGDAAVQNDNGNNKDGENE